MGNEEEGSRRRSTSTGVVTFAGSSCCTDTTTVETTTTTITTIPNVSSYTKTELQSMWYTPTEYVAMKVTRIKDIATLVKQKKQNKKQKTAGSSRRQWTTRTTNEEDVVDLEYDDGESCCCCWLGLVTPQERQKQLDRINRSRMIVLEFEQTKIDDVKQSVIASAYMETTQTCQMEARRRAEKLQQDLQLHEERELLQQRQQVGCIRSGDLETDHHQQQQHGNNSATCASLSTTTIATSTKTQLSVSSFSSSLSLKVQPLVTTTRVVGAVLPVVGTVPIERRSA